MDFDNKKNKGGCHCNNQIDTYIDITKIASQPWESADYILGMSCNEIVVLEKPLLEFTEEDKEKLNLILIEGDGTKFLSDDGTYKNVAIDAIILTYFADTANFVIQNNPMIQRIWTDISNGLAPQVWLNYNGYNIPLNASFMGDTLDLQYENQVIYAYLRAPFIRNKLVINISLNMSINPPTINRYEFNTFEVIDGVLNVTGDGKSALYNDGEYKETYTADQTDIAIQDGVLGESERAIERENELQQAIDNTNIALTSEVNRAIAKEQELDNKIEQNSIDIANINSSIDDVQNNLGNHIAGYNEFKDTVNDSFNTVNNALNTTNQRVAQNEIDIQINTQGIDALRDEISQQGHFRGSFDQNSDIFSINNPQQGDYAYSLESGTIWIYDSNADPATWMDTGNTIPSGVYSFSNDIPLQSTPTGDAGTATTISRSDHRHPSDDGKADVTELNNYLPLAGNSQTDPMTGGIYLGSENKLYVSDSANSYIGLNTDTLEVNGNGAGGVDLLSELGEVKYNGVEVATVDDVSTVSDAITAEQQRAQGVEQSLQSDIDAEVARATNAEELLSDRIDNIDGGLTSYVQKSGDTMTGTLSITGGNLSVAQNQFAQFNGNSVRIGYATNALNIIGTGATEGINITTDTNTPTSTLKYNGFEILTQNDIINNLSSTSTEDVLSANQGNVLKLQIDNLQTQIDNIDFDIEDSPSIAQNGNQLDVQVSISDETITIESDGIKCNISIEKDGNDLILIGKDRAEIGRVTVDTAGIASGYFDEETNEIVLVLDDASEIRIPAASLITVYTASGYIQIDSNNNITLNYNNLVTQLQNDGFKTGNYVDLTTSQTVGGSKRFTSNISVNKAATTDGIGGSILTTGGALHLQSASSTTYPSIYGYLNDATTAGGFINFNGAGWQVSPMPAQSASTSSLLAAPIGFVNTRLNTIVGEINNSLSNYLPLSGGVLSGALTTNGIILNAGISVNASGVNIGSNGNRIATGYFTALDTGNITPITNTTYNLGTSTNRWANVYASSGSFTGSFVIGSTLNVSGLITTGQGIAPVLNGAADIGTNALRYGNIYGINIAASGALSGDILAVSRNATIAGTLSVTGAVSTANNINPSSNGTQNLGTTSLRWIGNFSSINVSGVSTFSANTNVGGSLSVTGAATLTSGTVNTPTASASSNQLVNAEWVLARISEATSNLSAIQMANIEGQTIITQFPTGAYVDIPMNLSLTANKNYSSGTVSIDLTVTNVTVTQGQNLIFIQLLKNGNVVGSGQSFLIANAATSGYITCSPTWNGLQINEGDVFTVRVFEQYGASTWASSSSYRNRITIAP